MVKKDKNKTTAYGTNTLTLEQFEKICRLISVNENIVIKLMPGGGKSSVTRILEEAKQETKHPSLSVLRLVEFLGLDCELDTSSAQSIIQDFLLSKTGENNVNLGFVNFLKRNKLYIVLDNFTQENESLSKYLLALRNSYGRNLKFIIVMNVSEYEDMSALFKTKYSSLLHNAIEIHYFNDETAEYWMDLIVKELDIKKLSKQDKKFIVKVCGGVPFLIKNFLRSSLYYDDLEATFKSEEFREMVEIFWHKLSKKEQLVIKTLYYQGKLLDISKVTEHLMRFGLIENENIRGKWVELVNQFTSPKLSLEGDKILWDDVDFTDEFTQNEYDILKALIVKNGAILDRDEIAKIIWGKNASSEYSAWAIDQNISRLRKHLEELGIPKDVLVTVKKKGVKLA